MFPEQSEKSPETHKQFNKSLRNPNRTGARSKPALNRTSNNSLTTESLMCCYYGRQWQLFLGGEKEGKLQLLLGMLLLSLALQPLQLLYHLRTLI